ncbi:hypothetical protein [Acidicapsa ligni]|uniref:hypothetical protein n=1 Tax=Acidicapsa ligni TaxID=542300 RepID=UPI0021E090E0|nr:hypothetical protein [Acidicapsa ligni]
MLAPGRLFSQAAILIEEPYGVFGELNPTGHAAFYFEHICAETPTHLRHCLPGEPGIVLSRYKGIAGYDWIAIPLVPYLYAVEDPALVPTHVDQDTVDRLRDHYRELRLADLGDNLPKGNFINGGWTEMVGVSYDRRMYAFRFDTTIVQDNALIAYLNASPNHSHFNILFNNCADFDRLILNFYFPHKFGRTLLPDAGITTPKHLAYSLQKYAAKHPETDLAVFAIPQVPGYRRNSNSTDGVAESLIKRGYFLPIIVLNPYVAGGILADYLIRGRYPIIPRDTVVLQPTDLQPMTEMLDPVLTESMPQNENLLKPLPSAQAIDALKNPLPPSPAAQN